MIMNYVYSIRRENTQTLRIHYANCRLTVSCSPRLNFPLQDERSSRRQYAPDADARDSCRRTLWVGDAKGCAERTDFRRAATFSLGKQRIV